MTHDLESDAAAVDNMLCTACVKREAGLRVGAEIEQQHLSSEIEQSTDPILSYAAPDLQLGGKREGKDEKKSKSKSEKKRQVRRRENEMQVRDDVMAETTGYVLVTGPGGRDKHSLVGWVRLSLTCNEENVMMCSCDCFSG